AFFGQQRKGGNGNIIFIVMRVQGDDFCLVVFIFRHIKGVFQPDFTICMSDAVLIIVDFDALQKVAIGQVKKFDRHGSIIQNDQLHVVLINSEILNGESLCGAFSSLGFKKEISRSVKYKNSLGNFVVQDNQSIIKFHQIGNIP